MMETLDLGSYSNGRGRWHVIEDYGTEEQAHVGTIRKVDRHLFQYIHPAGSGWATSHDEAFGFIREALLR